MVYIAFEYSPRVLHRYLCTVYSVLKDFTLFERKMNSSANILKKLLRSMTEKENFATTIFHEFLLHINKIFNIYE